MFGPAHGPFGTLLRPAAHGSKAHVVVNSKGLLLFEFWVTLAGILHIVLCMMYYTAKGCCFLNYGIQWLACQAAVCSVGNLSFCHRTHSPCSRHEELV